MNQKDRLEEELALLRGKTSKFAEHELDAMAAYWDAAPHETRFVRRANLARMRVFKEEASRRKAVAEGSALVASVVFPGHPELVRGTVGGDWAQKYQFQRVRVCRRNVRACGFSFPVTERRHGASEEASGQEEEGMTSLMVQTGRDEIAKTSECLERARSEEIASASHAEDVLETLLNDAPLHDGEGAHQAVLDVWHLAASTTRALVRVEKGAQEALRLLSLPMAEGFVLEPRLREVLVAALGGGEA